MRPTIVRCIECHTTFELDTDRAHQLRSIWTNDGTRTSITCRDCTNSWPHTAPQEKTS